MNQKITQNVMNPANRLFGQLMAEKKKFFTALCLIGVMVFMWAKLLLNKSPEAASAANFEQMSYETGANQQSKISFINLPEIEGRNDVLTRDFFTVRSWYDFVADRRDRGNVNAVGIVSADKADAVAARIIQRLKLDVIELGAKPQVFINDKLLTIGDTLVVEDSVQTYECQIVGIEKNRVLIRCGEAEIELKLTQMIEMAN